MKKRNLRLLSLNKKVVSKFDNTQLGGFGKIELITSVTIETTPTSCGCTEPVPGHCPPTILVTCYTTCSPETCYAC